MSLNILLYFYTLFIHIAYYLSAERTKYKSDAIKWDQRATRSQLAFWYSMVIFNRIVILLRKILFFYNFVWVFVFRAELLLLNPNLVNLSLCAQQLNTASANAQEAYKRLLKIGPAVNGMSFMFV